MLRSFACAVLALACAVGVLVAAEIKGKVKSVDTDKKTITVTTSEDKEVTVSYNDDTKFTGGKGNIDREKAIGRMAKTPGGEVTITTEKKDDKDVATEIKVKFERKKKDK